MSVTDEETRGLPTVIRATWTALGPVGRAVLVALVLSAVVALALGFWIPKHVETHFVMTEIDSRHRVVDQLTEAGLLPLDPQDPEAIAALDEYVRLRLLGADTVRVKVWLPDGTIAYSDEPALIGERYPSTPARLRAFAGEVQSDIPDLTLADSRFERGLPPLREYYIPVFDGSDEVVALFEVYGLAEHIDAAVTNIRRFVWGSVALSIGLLAVFTVGLMVESGRVITRRRRLAEKLFGDLVQAQAEERNRIIGSLHDDIGQSLYRIHYGLEDLRSRVGPDSSLAPDLSKLSDLVAGVDRSLRAALRSLRHGTGENLSLSSALDELAEVTEMETGLDVDVVVEESHELAPVGRVALFRAAREAVTNVRKHAAASRVKLRVHGTSASVFVDVIDDGVGIDGEEGLGLTTTRERLEALGGGLRVRRLSEGGTLFRAWVPRSDTEVDL